MKKIWKFALEITDLQELKMPHAAVLLDVQVQHGVVCLWALCEINALPTTRAFRIFGTGHAVPSEIGAYVGTFQWEDALVFHVFEAL